MAQKFTQDLWGDLKRINNEVNNDINYKTDLQLYERKDYWTIVKGKGRGDCDDYAITKIKRLVNETKWYRKNLGIGICYTEDKMGRPGKGGGHAVAIARTDRGDFVLDNRYPKVMPYRDLPYKWIAFEDYQNKKWVLIEE